MKPGECQVTGCKKPGAVHLYTAGRVLIVCLDHHREITRPSLRAPEKAAK